MTKLNWHYYRFLLIATKLWAAMFGAGAVLILCFIILGAIGVGPKYDPIAIPMILVFLIIPVPVWKLSSWGLRWLNENKPS